MKAFSGFVSVLLLIVLGSVLGTEAFGKSLHIQSCADELFIGSAEANQPPHLLKNSYKDSHHQNQSEKCADPCHVGVSHFGHCWFVSSELSIHPKGIDFSCPSSSFYSLVVEFPLLEGPRRPPRLS